MFKWQLVYEGNNTTIGISEAKIIIFYIRVVGEIKTIKEIFSAKT